MTIHNNLDQKAKDWLTNIDCTCLEEKGICWFHKNQKEKIIDAFVAGAALAQEQTSKLEDELARLQSENRRLKDVLADISSGESREAYSQEVCVAMLISKARSALEVK